MNRVVQIGSRSLVQLRQLSSVAKQGAIDAKSLTPQTKFGPMSDKVKHLQAQYQDPLNDRPMYLKGGRTDNFLFIITALVIVGGVINAAQRAYQRATGGK